jgi:hypothetical protein
MCDVMGRKHGKNGKNGKNGKRMEGRKESNIMPLILSMCSKTTTTTTILTTATTTRHAPMVQYRTTGYLLVDF